MRKILIKKIKIIESLSSIHFIIISEIDMNIHRNMKLNIPEINQDIFYFKIFLLQQLNIHKITCIYKTGFIRQLCCNQATRRKFVSEILYVRTKFFFIRSDTV